MQTTRPFFHALESILRSRLPSDEFAQVMEESLWELEACGETFPLQLSGSRSARMASVCLSFYRAMTKTGIAPDAAIEILSQAGSRLEPKTDTRIDRGSCSIAAYFRSKNALAVCRAVFCEGCPAKATGCAQAEATVSDWVPTAGA